MADPNSIAIEITLDDGSTKKVFAQLNSEAKKVEKNLDEAGDGLLSSLTSIKTAIVGIAAAAGAGVFFKKAIDSAIEAETAVTALGAALASQGQFSKAAVADFADYAGALEKVTGINDDIITQNAALLAGLGKLSGQGLKDATKAALDLAQAAQIDVGTAFNQLAKAADGDTAALGRYNVKVDESIPRSQRFAKALELIQQQLGGSAESRLSTFAGALDTVSNGFDSLLKTIGKFVTQSPVVRELIKIIGESFQTLAKTLQSLSGNNDFVGALILKFVSFGGVIQQVINAVRYLGLLFDAVFKGAMLGVQLVIQVFTEMYGLIAQGLEQLGVTNKFTEFFNNLKTASRDVTTQLVSDVQNSVKAIDNFVPSTTVQDYLSTVEQKLKDVSTQSLITGEDLKNNMTKPLLPVVNLGYAFSTFAAGFREEASSIRESAQKNFAAAGKAAFQGIGQGVGQAFAAFGKALAKGENALEAFAQSFLSSIGQVLIQMGTSFILQGLAAIVAPGPALAVGITDGPGLIAAGAAMAAFGGLLSASTGGSTSGAGASGGGGGGGGVAITPAQDSSDLTGIADLQNAEPQTQVVVNIAGDVLDSDTTGTRIVDLINTAFDKKGVVIQRGAIS